MPRIVVAGLLVSLIWADTSCSPLDAPLQTAAYAIDESEPAGIAASVKGESQIEPVCGGTPDPRGWRTITECQAACGDGGRCYYSRTVASVDFYCFKVCAVSSDCPKSCHCDLGPNGINLFGGFCVVDKDLAPD